MKLFRVLAAVAVAASVSTAAYAQEDIIKLRKQLMESNGQAVKLIVSMLRNQVPYDPVIVSAALSTVSHDNSVFFHLFPAGSETGFETLAKPELFADMAGFTALSEKMAADAAAAAEAAAGDRQAFIAAFKTVSDGCNACHEKYRFEEEN